MFQCEENRFDDRPAVIDGLVVASVVCFVECVELSMFDDRADSSIPEFVPERVPVVAFVGGNRGELSEVSREYLSSNLCIVRLFHRAMNVEDDAGIAIDERCRLDIVKIVADPEDVVTAGLMAFEAGCVDRLNVAKLV